MPTFIKYAASGRLHLTVDKPVGLGTEPTPNLPDDVLLVQFLLNGVFRTLMPESGLGGPLALDGIFGEHTHYRLLLFQRQAFQTGIVIQSITGYVAKPIMGVDPERESMSKLNIWFFWGNPGVATTADLLKILPPRLLPALDAGITVSGSVRFGARY